MRPAAAIAIAALALLALVAPRGAGPARAGALAWLACVAAAAMLLGGAAGVARIAAIDAGALDLPRGARVAIEGNVTAVPTRSGGEVSVAVSTSRGRLLVRAFEPVADLPIGGIVRATGTIRDPGEWEQVRLRRRGIRDLLEASAITPVGGARAGLWGVLDGVRSRAETALGEETSEATASLLRGFVLGQDDRIEDATVDEFKRSGLAHLLAVSGQNVVLLSLLTMVVLAALDVPLRARLLWTLAVIALYVPVAGAGASIQRAGVMGAAGIVAALAQRPRSRAYALLLAAAVTLALDPRASADIGWQLSFAAVAGIMVGAAPIAAVLAGNAGGWRRGLAEAAGLTVAATLATAPLLAHHFDTVSLVSLPANLVALPAVAPVMWLGMLAGALGQLEWLPVEPLTWLAGHFAAYIAQVAAWFAAPSWAQAELELGTAATAGATAATGIAAFVVVRWAGRRSGMRTGRAPPGVRRRLLGGLLGIAVAALAVSLLGGPAARDFALRVSVLDVGQGDSILLEPAGAPAVLIDAGPPDADVAGQLEQLGIERLAGLAVTHPDLDHEGGAAAVLERLEVRRLLGARLSPATLAAARASGTTVARIDAGDRVRSGALRLEVVWPPPSASATPGETNLQSLVILARLGEFEILLTGDAEAEAAPVAPGPVDVLKVAHHGSEDAGLAALLDTAKPQLALISVGADNGYGHPAPSTLAALSRSGVPVLRTDEAGEIVVEVGETGWTVR